jgi:light-harvesting complex 1 beta chain
MTTANAELVKAGAPAFSAGYQLIFLLSYFVFLLVALAASVTGLQWRRWFPGADADTSLFMGVKSAVYTFMSHLI